MAWTIDPKNVPPSSTDDFVDPKVEGISSDATKAPAESNSSQDYDQVGDLTTAQWFSLAKEAAQASTTFFDENYRAMLDDSIKMFKSEFPTGSRFNHPGMQNMSHMFRPKTRSVVRKQEAAAAVAFFSNVDSVTINPMNENSQPATVAASLMKQIVNYRLDVDIPWFTFLIGAYQDALVQGVAIAETYWDFEKRDGKILKDHPCFELIELENFRFDPGSNWLDVVNSSPYLIHIRPMFVGDVKEKMKSGEWKQLGGDVIRRACGILDTSTSQVRRNRNQANSSTIGDYERVEVQRHIHRHAGVDYEFYTLADVAMLSDPKPLEEEVWTGKRPYVIGNVVLEAHQQVPQSLVYIAKDLQEEANTIANQRLDNVKFALNKRWIAVRGKNVDLRSLTRNVPGGVTLVDDLEDVKEVSFPDVTASSFQEQDRINVDMDELQGNFSAGSIMTNRKLNETVGGMKLLSGNSNAMVEYNLRTFTQTFVEPLLRMLVQFEQKYESDERIMMIAAQKGKLFTRYGVDKATDTMLKEELLLRVNVGMGATDPIQRVQNLEQGINAVVGYAAQAANLPGMDLDEIAKEIFGALGYADGTRFFDAEKQMAGNPQLAQAQQVIQQLTQALNDKQAAIVTAEQTKKDVAQIAADNKILVQHMINMGWVERAAIAAKQTPPGTRTQDDVDKTIQQEDGKAIQLEAVISQKQKETSNGQDPQAPQDAGTNPAGPTDPSAAASPAGPAG